MTKKILIFLLSFFCIFYQHIQAKEDKKQKSANNTLDAITTATPILKTEDIRNFNIKIISFGYKYGVPVESNIIMDVNLLPNPHFDKELKENNGFNLKVKNYILSSKITKQFLDNLYKFLDSTIPMYIKQEGGRNNLVIGIGCEGGTHRSVVIAEAVNKYLKERKYKVEVLHRDINKK
ncbi:MAG: hypothetical protein A2539_07005 [Elusimicrobia bacterium RIFOXYD2_FULL_34_15]|nr:MAG: hypothetical protein A2539_07005 [Elusimicrobia bacterium RIFOXYD2_FULL_34_15]